MDKIVIKNKQVKDYLINKFNSGDLTLSILTDELQLKEKHVGDLWNTRLYDILEEGFMNEYSNKAEYTIYNHDEYTATEIIKDVIEDNESINLYSLLEKDKQALEKFMKELKADYRLDTIKEILKEMGEI